MQRWDWPFAPRWRSAAVLATTATSIAAIRSTRRASQVKVGATTKPEALALLGTPSTTSTVGGDAWYYIGQKMKHTLQFMPVQMADQHVLAVYFDKDGKVDRIANYGMQDGKVFDFVSRTTPTGGQEPDFLRNMMGGLFRFT